MNIKHKFRLCGRVLVTYGSSQVSYVICHQVTIYLYEWRSWTLCLHFLCVWVIPSWDCDGFFNCFIYSVLEARERVQSNQEVNYLALTTSHGIHISQQALLMPTDCLLLSLSLTVSVSGSHRHAKAMHSGNDRCFRLVDAASWGCVDVMYSDTHSLSMSAHT